MMDYPTILVVILASQLAALIIFGVMTFIKLHELHAVMNSRLDELILTTKMLARAEGFKAGIDQAVEDRLEAIRATGQEA